LTTQPVTERDLKLSQIEGGAATIATQAQVARTLYPPSTKAPSQAKEKVYTLHAKMRDTILTQFVLEHQGLAF